MKKGYMKLCLFEIIILLFLLLNLFVFKYLSGFKTVAFLIILLIIFKLLFGFEKDNHRYVKDFILDELIFLIIFFLVYYLSGILFGFTETNYLNMDGLTRFILPTTLYIIFREYFRYMIFCKAGNNKVLIVLSIILIFLMDISESFYFASLGSFYNKFVYISIIILPSLCNNVVFSYITTKIGYKPVMFYSLILGLYTYIIPIIPNPNQYIQALILLILPILLGYKAYKFLEKTKQTKLERNYYKKRYSLKSIIPTSIIVMIIVYFTSGYFNYWAIVIASGSMSKSINKGDVVIIHKVHDDFDKLEVGDVLAYEYQGKIIVHRIEEKFKVEGKYYFSTKGDANNNIDDVIIEEDMIVGSVNFKIPLIGYPTVWINEL